MSHQFKMSNKHVFCQHSWTRLHFSIVKSDQRLRVKEFKIIFVEGEGHSKAKIYDKKLNRWHPKTNKTNHSNVATSMEITYIGLYHVYSCIQRQILTNNW